MISLNNFINRPYEYDELYWHLLIEFKLTYPTLCESYSFASEIYKVSEKILDIILKNLDKDKVEITDIKASFFNKLTIYLKQSKFLNGYTLADKQTKENVYITLELNKTSKPDKIDLLGTLEHELLHAYEGHHILAHNKSITKTYTKGGYNKIVDLYNNKNPDEELAKYMLYIFNPHEIRAYIHQTLTEIMTKKPNNAIEAWNLVSKTEYHQSLVIFYSNKDNIVKYLKDNHKIDICKGYREVYDNKDITDTQIKHKIIAYIDKGWKTYVNKMSKACVGRFEYKKDEQDELVKTFDNIMSEHINNRNELILDRGMNIHKIAKTLNIV